MHLIVLIDDKAQVEARFGLFGDSANLDSRLVHGLHQTYHRVNNHFGRTRWNYEVMRHKWNVISVLFVDSANPDAR
jgi:hypothetical protein